MAVPRNLCHNLILSVGSWLCFILFRNECSKIGNVSAKNLHLSVILSQRNPSRGLYRRCEGSPCGSRLKMQALASVATIYQKNYYERFPTCKSLNPRRFGAGDPSQYVCTFAHNPYGSGWHVVLSNALTRSGSRQEIIRGHGIVLDWCNCGSEWHDVQNCCLVSYWAVKIFPEDYITAAKHLRVGAVRKYSLFQVSHLPPWLHPFVSFGVKIILARALTYEGSR